MNIGDKRAQICAMGFIPVAASVVRNIPGVETIQVSVWGTERSVYESVG